MPATVERIEYDPNRTAHIALISYKDKEKAYIISPQGLKQGDVIESGKNVEIKVGNSLELRDKLSLCAYNRASDFSWNKCSSDTFKFLHKVYEKNKSNDEK